MIYIIYNVEKRRDEIRLSFWFLFGFPVALVGAILNLMPTFALRYNLVKLHSLYRINLRRNDIKDKSKECKKIA